jgi:transposase InsO family protein
VCRVFGVSRATLYRSRRQLELPFDPPKKRGPKTKFNDERLLELIRDVLAKTTFTGEGHRKVWARLRFEDVRTSKRRVLRLMREHGLLAPTRAVRVLGPRNHDGTIVTSVPDTMWGTDLTSTFTLLDGWVSVFVAVDHCTAECVGIHAAKRATRYEALDPIRQGVRDRFGGYRAGAAAGLAVRHDHGSQYVSDVFQAELAFLGAQSSPAFVRSPEGNGCAERFIRTLKEQLLWARRFETVEELRLALVDFKRTYNERWLIERLGHRTPAQARADLVATREAA